MSDFTTVRKYLRRVFARKATANEALIYNTRSGSSNPAKYYTLATPSRSIKLINEEIVIPANQVHTEFITPAVPRLLFQYNVTTDAPFAILDIAGKDSILQGLLTVKWRVGSAVKRYIIAGKDTITFRIPPPDHEVNILYFEDYINQTVPANFCLEFWSLYFQLGVSKIGIMGDLKLKTSHLVEPFTADELSRDIDIEAPIGADLIEFPVDSNFPINNEFVAFSDNP